MKDNDWTMDFNMFTKHSIRFMVEGSDLEKKYYKLGAKDKYDTVTMISFLEYGYNFASKMTKPPVDTSLADEIERLKKKLQEQKEKNIHLNETIDDLNARLSDSEKNSDKLEAERKEKERLNQIITNLEKKNADLLFRLEKNDKDSEGLRADMNKSLNNIKNEMDSMKTKHLNDVAQMKSK